MSLTNPDDYSPAETLIPFPHPIPLLRHPIPSLTSNSSILCFKSLQSFTSAYTSCKSSILHQCSAGARIACSVTASSNCAPPWWKTITGGGVSKQELDERERCEERVMGECLEGFGIKCRKLAGEKCRLGFRDARVVVVGSDEGVKKCVDELVGWVWFGGKRVGGVELCGLECSGLGSGAGLVSWSRIKSRIGFAVVRGSELLKKE